VSFFDKFVAGLVVLLQHGLSNEFVKPGLANGRTIHDDDVLLFVCLSVSWFVCLLVSSEIR